MWPSGSTQVDVTMQGGSYVLINDHAQDHRQLGSVVNQQSTVWGTTPGTNLLRNISAASDQLLAANSGGTLRQNIFNGTWTNGTINNGVFATASINTPTAYGIYSNGSISNNATITWTNGDRQCATMAGNATLVYAGTAKGQILTLDIEQNATGGYTCVFPTQKWPGTSAGTIGTAASSIHTLTVFCNQNAALLAQLQTNYG